MRFIMYCGGQNSKNGLPRFHALISSIIAYDTIVVIVVFYVFCHALFYVKLTLR